MKNPDTLFRKCFYHFTGFMIKNISRIFFGLQLYGLEDVPLNKNYIIVSNHISLIDPPVVGGPLNRDVFFMAKKELFDSWLGNKFFNFLHTFPVNRRGFTRSSIRIAVKLLKQKRKLVIFPQGTRSKKGFLPFKSGVGYLVHSSQSDVLPVYIENSNHLGDCLKRKKRLKVCYGNLIPYSEFDTGMENEKEIYAGIAEKLQQTVLGLKEKYCE